MDLNDDDIKEFIQLYRDEFDEEISFADAKQRAQDLLQLFRILLSQENRVRTEGDDERKGASDKG
jgi:hypothetical protein